MRYILISPIPEDGKVPIEGNEAVDLLVEHGFLRDRALILIDALPAGVGITFYVNGRGRYEIERTG